MTSEEKVQFLQYLFSAAWADGTLREAEQGILSTLVATVELAAADEARVRGWFDEAPEMPDWDAASADGDLRRMVLRQAMTLTGSDMVFNVEEMQFLERLRDRLGISEEEFHEVSREVERSLAEGP